MKRLRRLAQMEDRAYAVVDRLTRGWPYQIRHPALGLVRFLQAQPRPILVYQMGKVGSTSVCTALRNARLRPLHVHYLGETSRAARLQYEKSAARPPIHLYVEGMLHPYLKLTRHRLKVVTLVRDPIAREISGEFQTHELYGHDIKDVDARIAHIRDRLLAGKGLEYCASWFDDELLSVFGVDVPAHPFDREAGYSVVPGERVDVLTLRLEDLNWQALSEFVGRPLEPVWQNLRADMEGANEYREVKARLQLPREALERYYDHPWIRTFYDERRVRGFIERWASAR